MLGMAFPLCSGSGSGLWGVLCSAGLFQDKIEEFFHGSKIFPAHADLAAGNLEPVLCEQGTGPFLSLSDHAVKGDSCLFHGRKDDNLVQAALFVVDVMKEANAVKEAKRLNIPVFAIVDTCCDPTDIDYVIPANDDASNSIAVILDVMCSAIAEGLEERRLEKEKEAQENAASEAEGAPKKEGKPRIKKAVKANIDAEEAAVADVVAATQGAEAPAAETAAPAAAETAE